MVSEEDARWILSSASLCDGFGERLYGGNAMAEWTMDDVAGPVCRGGRDGTATALGQGAGYLTYGPPSCAMVGGFDDKDYEYRPLPQPRGDRTDAGVDALDAVARG